ncbi:MAG: family 10 glycosylhydrolase, partial [Ignavibacteria bacterium]|nr:family 10 glycosylhydrolase [Ignavibacteria bacterium]
WDPLEFLLNEAHRIGIEVHAWFNLYKIRGKVPVGLSQPLHLTRAKRHWTVQYEEETWLDPGIPEVRSYLTSVAMDLVRNYDIDGIQFDFIRYPGRYFPDSRTHHQHGKGMDLEDWRRSNIDKFVSEFYDCAIALKPMLKVGSTPLAIYQGGSGNNTWGSYYTYYQDSQAWLLEKKHDYLAPQIYWDIGYSTEDPDFAEIVRKWKNIPAGRHIYVGIGAYKTEILREIPAQIDTVRTNGLAGYAFFRYEDISDFRIFEGRHQTLANIPPMSWKDSVPPLPPSNLTVSEIATNVFHLEWIPPAGAQDGDEARYYNIYRSSLQKLSTDDPFNLIAITSSNDNHFVDTVKSPSGLRYYYAVTSFDKGNNESMPSNTASALVKEMLAIKRKLSNVTGLSMSVINGDGAPTLVAYELPERTFVSLNIFEQLSDMSERLVTTITRGVQEPGIYVVGVGKVDFAQSRYVIRLKAGDTPLEQFIDLRGH